MIQKKWHRNRRLTIKRKSTKILNSIIANIRYMIWFFVISLIFVWVYIFLVKTIFSDFYKIKTVTISNENIYINKTIKNIIDDFFLGNNYFVSKMNKHILLGNIAEKNINIVNDIFIDRKWQNVIININYQSPSLVLSMWNKLWWCNSGYFFELSSQYSIYSGNKIINVKVFSGDDVSSVFFETTPEALAQQINSIYTKISVKDNFWIPSAYKIGIYTDDDKLLYFDVKKNVFEQIKKYEFIKNNYKKYNQIKEMDLWTIDDSIFIK